MKSVFPVVVSLSLLFVNRDVARACKPAPAPDQYPALVSKPLGGNGVVPVVRGLVADAPGNLGEVGVSLDSAGEPGHALRNTGCDPLVCAALKTDVADENEKLADKVKDFKEIGRAHV